MILKTDESSDAGGT